MNLGKWLVVFSLTLLLFLVTTSVVASPVEKEKTIRNGQIILSTAPAPGKLAANLVWSRAAGNVSSFRIERSVDGGATWPTFFTASVPTTTYQDASVARSGTYWYRIWAITNSANSTASNIVRIHISDTAPASPIFLAAEINGADTINLSWNNISTTVDGYIVERAAVKGPGFVFQEVARLKSPLETSWTDTGLPAGSVYTYEVRAFNQFGFSYPSNKIEIITPRHP